MSDDAQKDSQEPFVNFTANAEGNMLTLDGKGKYNTGACKKTTKKISGKRSEIIQFLPDSMPSSNVDYILISSSRHTDDCHRVCYVPVIEGSAQPPTSQPGECCVHVIVCCKCGKNQDETTQPCEHQFQCSKCKVIITEAGSSSCQHDYSCSKCSIKLSQLENQCKHYMVCCKCGYSCGPTGSDQTGQSGGNTGTPQDQQQGSSQQSNPQVPDDKAPEGCIDMMADHMYSDSSMVKLLSSGKNFTKIKVWNGYKEEIELKILACFK